MRLHIHLKNGRTLSTARSSARGWPEQPATWGDIGQKYRECCEGVIPASRVEDSIALIQTLDQLQDVRPLLEALRGAV